jgi:TonB family protein
MTHRRNLFVAAVLALVTTPSLMFARPDAPPVTPHTDDFVFISALSHSPVDPAEPVREISVEKSGTIPAKGGMRLRVNADPGNVHILTDESAQISYRVRVEADAREPGAEDLLRRFTITNLQTARGILLIGNLPWRTFHGPFTVSYEIHVPRRFNIAVHTLGGNIEVQDIEGRVDLFTEGGNITAGRVDAGQSSSVSPNVESQGRAVRIAAKLTTMGGHIVIGDVDGTLRASTSGGHITAGNIGGDAILRTGGGQIRTGRISGGGTLDTGGGNITVWLNDVSAQGDVAGKNASDKNTERYAAKNMKSADTVRATSQFTSGEGDVIVYLPREIAVTIDAVIDQRGGHKILADPSLPQKIDCHESGPGGGPGDEMIHCAGDLNGGGEVLHLRAAFGNIVLKAGDSRGEPSRAESANWTESALHPPAFEPAASGSRAASNSDEAEDFNDTAGFFAEVRRRILETWWGGVPVDADEMQRHLEHSVPPVYPDVARKAGVEGDVLLRVYVSSEGRVTNLKVLEGSPILARAAVEAVQRWQYHALKVNGQPVAAVTTMIVSFRLQ